MGETQFYAWEDSYYNLTGDYPKYGYEWFFASNINNFDEYYDSQGDLITGQVVYAVKKGLGQWGGVPSQGIPSLSAPIFPQSDQSNWILFSGNENWCNLNTAINTFNGTPGQNTGHVADHNQYWSINVDDLKCQSVKNNGDLVHLKKGVSFRFLMNFKENKVLSNTKSEQINIVIHPNPVNHKFMITMDSKYDLGSIKYRVYTPSQVKLYEDTFALGEKLLEKNSISSSNTSIDVRLFERGIYFLKLVLKNGTIVSKKLEVY